MPICEIILSNPVKDILAGVVVMTPNGMLSYKATDKKYEAFMKETMEDKIVIEVDGRDKLVSRHENPRAWFNALPSYYDGVAIQARIIG